MAGIEFESRSGAVGAQAYEIFTKAFEQGSLVRLSADVIALSPPLIVESKHIDKLVMKLSGGIGGHDLAKLTEVRQKDGRVSLRSSRLRLRLNMRALLVEGTTKNYQKLEVN